MMSDVFRALSFAAEAHKDQRRKGAGGSPYVNHLIECAALMTGVAKIDNTLVIQAAILHDILEDTSVTEDQLLALFGEKVVEYVKAVTDDKRLNLAERRAAQITHLKSASNAVKLIKLADHCSNIASIPADWSKERIESYISWSRNVVSLCFAASPELAEEYEKRIVHSGQTSNGTTKTQSHIK
ncbi:HD domain-containing protein [Sedimenticola selenatireducens]|uniref:HD domain-containing protein n=1 Tax=Sedimenticola selenatireducens TaxID=191960 RepID=UPI002AAB1362|nr:HD domain-containing protein [Sedimenticola selenatireducens]